MKKLMFAMAIAATVSFAQAEDTPIGTTTTFDTLTADTAFSTAVNTDWTNNTDTEGPVDATVKAYESVGDNGANYLQLDGVQNLAKKIGTAGTAIGDGLYIDTMVKFTASEDAPTPGDEDKLVVWLKETPGENDNPSTYTLMVTAGYVDTDKEALSSKSYETTANVIPDNWYHLRVKAIENVDKIEGTDGTPGFVVFIGDDVVTTTECPADTPEFFGETKYVDGDNDSYAIFPSMVGAGENNWNTITQLAFSGSGSIDTVGAFEGDCDPDDEPTEDWVDPTDTDAIAAIEGKQAAAAYPSLAGTAVAAVDAKKLTIWATGTGNVDFSDAATGINATAFLLNIANSSTAADIKTAEDTAKEAIKITAISFDENGDPVLTHLATYGNGKIVVEGSLQLPAVWHDKVDADKFFRTKLVLDVVAAPAVGE